MQHVIFITRQPLLAIGVELILTPHSQFKPVALSPEDANINSIFRSVESGVLLIDFTTEEDFSMLLSLRRQAPDMHIVIWTRKVSPEVVYQLVKVGVRGVCLSSSTSESLLQCVRTVAGGATWFDKRLDTTLVDFRTAALSHRETELVILVSQGLKNKEIAGTLGLSNATIRMYMSALFRKLGVKDRYELAIYGVRHLLGQPDQTSATAGDHATLPIGGTRLMVLQRNPARAESPELKNSGAKPARLA